MTDQRGFTLLEVVVAMAILAFGLTALLRSLDLGMRTASVVERERAATDAATILLTELGRSRSLDYGLSEGDLPHGQHWRLLIQRLRDRDPNAPARLIEGHRIDLTLSWMDRGRSRSLMFQTVRLGPDR